MQHKHKHERHVTLQADCHHAEPKKVRIAVHGTEQPDIGSLTIGGAWTSMHIAMARHELVTVRDAINAVLVATEA